MFSGNFVATLKAPIAAEVAVSRRRAARLKELLGW
jgi:hypothetical protein